jgi:hypothetical protein
MSHVKEEWVQSDTCVVKYFPKELSVNNVDIMLLGDGARKCCGV